MQPIKYDVLIEGEYENGQKYNIRVAWGQESEWIKKHRKELDGARYITLYPKKDFLNMPTVVVSLDENKRWILFSRVYGAIGAYNSGATEIRLYCIGWQLETRGVNVKNLMWIYPNGSVESAEEPGFVNLFF